jgi:transmembrane sensor
MIMLPDWELIAKYLADEATQSETVTIEKWLRGNPENERILRDLKKAMRPSRSEEPDFTPSMEEDWMQLQDKLLTSEDTLKLTPGSSLRGWYRIAASILLLVVSAIAIWFILDNKTTLWNGDRQFATVDSIRLVSLPDNSHVWLNKQTQLLASNDFGKKNRKVALEGEAYFEVAKDKTKPFVLTSGKITTTVVGTAFNVNFQTGGNVTITVTEGKVSVALGKNSAIFLNPGEAALYTEGFSKLTKQKNTDLNFLSWKTGVIRFEGTSLKNACLFLSKHYAADIRLKTTSLEQHSITTVLDNVELDEALSIIATTMDLRVEKKNSTIYFMD